MLIYVYFCGELSHTFTDKDTEQVEKMCRALDRASNDTTEYQLESGEIIRYWRKDGVIHGNIFGRDENDIPESSIANGRVDRSYNPEVQPKTSMKIEIYQIFHGRDQHRVKFTSLENMAKWQGSPNIDSHIYNKVFEGEVPCTNLEEVYTLFNTSRPEGHVGHSLSVSDVVKVCYNQPDLEQGFYYCDSVGFKKVDFEPTKAFSKLSRQHSSLNDAIDKAEAIKKEQEPVGSCENKNKDKEIDW